MTAAPLDFLPLWGFFLAAVGAIVLAMEAGYRIGSWRHARVAEEKEAPVGAMVGSILGLVAIMLAFTFNLAAARFDARRQAVLEEANAIGTTWLRARMLPEPERSRSVQLLREYVEARLQAVEARSSREGLARSEALHERLWQQAVTAAGRDERSIPTGLFIQSLNQVIDLHSERVLVGLRSRLPATIWVALFALALIGTGAMGYQAGLSATRRSPAALLLALAFAAVLYLIVDLDRAHEGLLRVSQASMVDLQRTMEAGAPGPAEP